MLPTNKCLNAETDPDLGPLGAYSEFWVTVLTQFQGNTNEIGNVDPGTCMHL